MKKIILLIIFTIIYFNLQAASTPTVTPTITKTPVSTPVVQAVTAAGLFTNGTTSAYILTMTAKEWDTKHYLIDNLHLITMPYAAGYLVAMFGSIAQLNAVKGNFFIVSAGYENAVKLKFANYAYLKSKLGEYLALKP